MITALDTNVLIDVLEADPQFGASSAAALALASRDGALVASEVVWAEVMTAYQPPDGVLEDLAAFGVRFDPMRQAAAQGAAAAWALYRAAGGRRTRIAADFLIGAHAALQADRLLTRDGGFYRGHFGPLVVVSPRELIRTGS